MPGEADVSDFALRLGPLERLDDAALGEVPLRVVVVDALVYLPEIEVVGAQARSDSSSCRIATFASRPCVQTLVIRNTESRRSAIARPIRRSLSPS